LYFFFVIGHVISLLLSTNFFKAFKLRTNWIWYIFAKKLSIRQYHWRIMLIDDFSRYSTDQIWSYSLSIWKIFRKLAVDNKYYSSTYCIVSWHIGHFTFIFVDSLKHEFVFKHKMPNWRHILSWQLGFKPETFKFSHLNYFIRSSHLSSSK